MIQYTVHSTLYTVHSSYTESARSSDSVRAPDAQVKHIHGGQLNPAVMMITPEEAIPETIPENNDEASKEIVPEMAPQPVPEESGKKKKLKKGKKVGKNKSDEDDALTTAQREFSLNLSLCLSYLILA